jgi:acyl-coenzyme A thioesterase PaaI-like protein
VPEPEAHGDPDLAEFARWAFAWNPAHRRLGTYLIDWDPSGVTVGLDWDDDRFGDAGSGLWPNGALTSLLDFSCAFSVVMGVGGPARVAGTVDLRVDYLWAGNERQDLRARAQWLTIDADLACTRSSIFHPGSADKPLAVATSVLALARAVPA